MRKNLFEKFKLAEKRLDHCVRFIWRQRQIIAAQEKGPKGRRWRVAFSAPLCRCGTGGSTIVKNSCAPF